MPILRIAMPCPASPYCAKAEPHIAITPPCFALPLRRYASPSSADLRHAIKLRYSALHGITKAAPCPAPPWQHITAPCPALPLLCSALPRHALLRYAIALPCFAVPIPHPLCFSKPSQYSTLLYHTLLSPASPKHRIATICYCPTSLRIASPRHCLALSYHASPLHCCASHCPALLSHCPAMPSLLRLARLRLAITLLNYAAHCHAVPCHC